MESALYGIYALVVFVSEILLVRCAHSFDFWYVNNSCVNTVRQHFPWSILYMHTHHSKMSMHSSHTCRPASQAHWEHAPLSWMPEDWSYWASEFLTLYIEISVLVLLNVTTFLSCWDTLSFIIPSTRWWSLISGFSTPLVLKSSGL